MLLIFWLHIAKQVPSSSIFVIWMIRGGGDLPRERGVSEFASSWRGGWFSQFQTLKLKMACLQTANRVNGCLNNIVDGCLNNIIDSGGIYPRISSWIQSHICGKCMYVLSFSFYPRNLSLVSQLNFFLKIKIGRFNRFHYELLVKVKSCTVRLDHFHHVFNPLMWDLVTLSKRVCAVFLHHITSHYDGAFQASYVRIVPAGRGTRTIPQA